MALHVSDMASSIGVDYRQSGHRLAIWSMTFSPPCRSWVFAWLLEVVLRRREFTGLGNKNLSGRVVVVSVWIYRRSEMGGVS